MVRAGEKAIDGVESIVGDFADAASLDAALRGIDRVFLVCGPVANLPELEGNVYAAVRRAKVQRVVKSSILGADEGSRSVFGALHGASENRLRASELPHVVLRPHYFLQNLLSAAQGVASGTYEDASGAALSMVDLRDVGDAAAAVLLGDDSHLGKTYELTGPRALDRDAIAELLAKATGREVRAVDLDPAEQHRRLAGYGLPPWFNDALETLYRDYRASGRHGYAAKVTRDVETLTGHAPRTAEAFVQENREKFS
jgi:uncharacterized protein YbjT (DUF2867 family)